MTDQNDLQQAEEQELPEIDPSTLDGGGAEEEEELEPIVVEHEEPLTLIGDEEMEAGESKIQALGKGALGAGATEFKRALNLTGQGATRCKVFHSKISPVPLEYMEKQINEWLDSADVEAKFVTKVVGVMEGKRPEPNVIVTIWY